MMRTLLQAAQKLFADIFDRSNGAVGARWVTLTSYASPLIVSNKLSATGSTVPDHVAYFNAILKPSAQFAQFDGFTASANECTASVSLCFDKTNYGNGYELNLGRQATGTRRLTLMRRKATSSTLLSETTVDAATDGIRLERRGNVLKAYIKVSGVWSLYGTYTDAGTPFITYYAGVRLHCGLAGTVVTFDNFVCGDL